MNNSRTQSSLKKSKRFEEETACPNRRSPYNNENQPPVKSLRFDRNTLAGSQNAAPLVSVQSNPTQEKPEETVDFYNCIMTKLPVVTKFLTPAKFLAKVVAHF